MHPIFLQLETDHQRMQRMLYDLNHQIESYFGLHDAPADVDAMMRCLDYIQIYPEVWHHPVEDIIFRQLLTKPGVNHYAVENVLRDHGMLEALSDQLSLIFSELRLSEKPVRPAIIRLSKHYHSRQISHIHEERGIFQMAGELFGDADWQAIEREIDAVIGPVGQHQRDDYLSTFKPEHASYSGAFKQ